MRSQFVQQVQVLMEIQQIKNAEGRIDNKSNYNWLCSKRFQFVSLSTNDEYKLLCLLIKITPEEQVEILRQLLLWIEMNPDSDPMKIPNTTMGLIDAMLLKKAINQANLSRMSTFRSSLRRFSMLSNRVMPAPIPRNLGKSRRSVTFNDKPIIYKISK